MQYWNRFLKIWLNDFQGEQLNLSHETKKECSEARIKWDLHELEREPVFGIAVTQLRADQPYKLHANISLQHPQRFGGDEFVIHLELLFDANYPIKPPQVAILTPFPKHPALHQTHTHTVPCLDILDTLELSFRGPNERSYFSTKGYYGSASGWCPAYSLRGLLVQLQCFLGQEVLGTTRGSDFQAIKDEVASYRCHHHQCGHTTHKPYPSLPTYQQCGLEALAEPAPAKEQKQPLSPAPPLMLNVTTDLPMRPRAVQGCKKETRLCRLLLDLLRETGEAGMVRNAPTRHIEGGPFGFSTVVWGRGPRRDQGGPNYSVATSGRASIFCGGRGIGSTRGRRITGRAGGGIPLRFVQAWHGGEKRASFSKLAR